MHNLDHILTQLTVLEPIFHRWEHLKNRNPTRTDFESLAAPDFFEIGASGTIYTREFVISTLERRYSDPAYSDARWETSDFRVHQLAPTTYLLTYTLIQHQSTGPRLTRRTTIWKESPSGWQILFHQGTLVHPN
jgi:hypothetical protein